MAQRCRVVLGMLAGILALSALGGPLPADATPAKTTIAQPTHLRPVQSKADCAVLSLMAVICDAAVRAGDLQLIWDDSNKTVTGYKVFRVDGGGHQLLGTPTVRYFVVKKPSEGYANLCFAVQALAGEQTSADSARYCYAPGATATTRSFKPSHMVTQVTWQQPPYINWDCGAYAAFFPFVKNTQPPYSPFSQLQKQPPTSGQKGVVGVYAGNEEAFVANTSRSAIAPCTGSVSGPGYALAEVNALAGMAFDLGELTKHKFYSASLALESVQTLVFASGKFTLRNGGWCAVSVGAATREWRIAPLGNLTSSKHGLVTLASHPPSSIDVSPIVSVWASEKYAAAFGFIVAKLPGPSPVRSTACVTKFAAPSLKVVYF